MADTQSANLLLTIQTIGGNNNTWGTLNNANMDTIDAKFGDVTSISTTGGTTTLNDTQELVNAIRVSGTLVSNATIVFTGRGGLWVIENNTTGSFSVTCKVSGQTGVVIEQGGGAIVFCNGTDIDYANPATAAANNTTVASASTCDILGISAEYVAISGTTTITSFGTGANKVRYVVATGTFKITHNGTSLICPGAVDLFIYSGDTFIVRSDSSGNCRIFAVERSGSQTAGAIPVGTIFEYAGSSAPAGWLLCYGQAISRTTYAALFNVLSTTYGAGDSVSTFNLPDLRGRVIAGKDNMGGTSANRLTGLTGGVDGDTLGATGGTETHTLASTEMPSHTHTGSTGSSGAHTHNISVASNGAASGASIFYAPGVGGPVVTDSQGAHTHTFTTDATGGGGAHNNVQPTLVLNKMIFTGVY